MNLQQIQANPLLNAIVAPYLQPGAQLGQTQASTALTQADLPPAQQKSSQVAFMQNARSLLDSAKDKNGYVDPKVYNTLQQQASSLNIPLDQFGSTFEGYTDPQKQIGINTPEGRAQSQGYGLVKRNIQQQLSQFNDIPQQEKGVWGNANIASQGVLQTALNNPLALGSKATQMYEGTKNYLQQNAPNALAYQQATGGLASQLKGLIGQSGLRVTQAEIDNWQSLMPAPGDSPETINKKVSELDASLKSTFNSDTGLDSKYLPQQNNRQATNQNGNPTLVAGSTNTPQQTGGGQGPTGGNPLMGILRGAVNPYINAINNTTQTVSANQQAGGNPLIAALKDTGALAGNVASTIPADITNALTVEGARSLPSLASGGVNALGNVLRGGLQKAGVPAAAPLDILKSLVTLGQQGGKQDAAQAIQQAAEKGADIPWESITSDAKNAASKYSPKVQQALNSLLYEQEPTAQGVEGDVLANQKLTSQQALNMRQSMSNRLSKNVFGQLNIPATDEEQQAANILRRSVSSNLKQNAPGISDADALYSFYSKLHGDAPTWATRLVGYEVAKRMGQSLPFLGPLLKVLPG